MNSDVKFLLMCISCFAIGRSNENVSRNSNVSAASPTEIDLTMNESDNEITTAFAQTSIPTCSEAESSSGSTCPPCYDFISVWPETGADTVARVPCPSLSDNVTLTGYATRQCLSNGTWNVKADYAVCIRGLEDYIKNQPRDENSPEMVNSVLEDTVILYIYIAGFGVSNLAMICAVVLFASFKRLRCLRNLIHIQLMTAMTIKNFMWMSLLILLYTDNLSGTTLCRILSTLYKYFLLSQFSWMFCEGLYLFMVIVKALMNDVLRLRHFLIIGWGIPFVVSISIFGLRLKSTLEGVNSASCWLHQKHIQSAEAFIEVITVYTLVLMNSVFMAAVVYTLIRKLSRSESRPYRKAIKATVVLIPLLGGSYTLLFSPAEENGITYFVWGIFSALLQSTQGFAVALAYCFLNNEVRTAIAKQYRRWKDEKTLPSHSTTWWSRRRQSSTRHTDIETYSSQRCSRRISDEIGSRRGSQTLSTTVDINSNKTKKSKDVRVVIIASSPKDAQIM